MPTVYQPAGTEVKKGMDREEYLRERVGGVHQDKLITTVTRPQ